MISIFAKPTFLNINPSQPFKQRRRPIPEGRGQLMRVSSMIRGDQIADKIGAKLNPKKEYENDVCIYVKPMVRKDEDFKFEGRPYLDIVDGHNLGHLAKKHPEVKVIVCSQIDMETMAGAIPNDIIFIPQHHCNFKRIKRRRKQITTVGVIGTRGAFPLLPSGLEEALKERQIQLIKFSRFFSRKDIVDFYKRIDVQLVWRPYKKILSNPLKLVNAMSFGIPTIALDEDAFQEIEECYIPVGTFEEFLERLDELRDDKKLYQTYSDRCLKKAEYYHIDNVAEMYKKLDDNN